MPLDRRITVNIAAEGTRDEHGEYVPGPVTSYPVWADVTGAGSTETDTTGGVLVSQGMNVTVRWFRELAVAPINRVHIVDDLGQRWDTDGIAESNERRRFLGMLVFRVEGSTEDA